MKTDSDINSIASKIAECSKQACEALAENNFDVAKEHFEEAFKLSKEIRDPFTERKCAFNLGAVYIRLCEARRGLEYLEQAVPPDSYTDKTTNNGDLYFNLGLAHELLKDFDNAVKYFKLALKEYRYIDGSHKDKMLIETLEKLSINSKYIKQYLDAAEWNKELCEIYRAQGNNEKVLITMGEQAVQLRKANEREKCLILTEQIVNRLDNIVITPLTANMLNDVGLVLCQYEKFDQAEKCYTKALLMISALTSCVKLNAILLQNMGALCNVTGNYSKSIEYLTNAAEKFGELNNAINEGHCYANLGYAYNQLGNVDKARENFMSALRKAKDNGDSHSEWQVLESLGVLCCNLGNVDVAIKYYTDAFKAITKDVNSNTTSAEDRIQTKLFNLMKQQAEKQQLNTQKQILVTEQQQLIEDSKQEVVVTKEEKGTLLQNTSALDQPVILLKKASVDESSTGILNKQVISSTSTQLMQVPNTLPVTQSAPELGYIKNQNKSHASRTRKELIKRRLKVRRSGSLKEFDKVARGVYVSMTSDVLDGLQEKSSSIHSSDFSFDEADTNDTMSSDTDTTESSDTESHKKSIWKQIKDKAEKKFEQWTKDKQETDTGPQRPKIVNISFAKRKTNNKDSPVNTGSILQVDEDKEEVKDLMRRHLNDTSLEDSLSRPGPSSSSKSKMTKSSDSSDTDVSVSSLSEEEEESDSEEEVPLGRHNPPTLPTSSPPTTIMNTYEKPEPLYTEIDFTQKSGENKQRETTEKVKYTEIEYRRGSANLGPNYFFDETDFMPTADLKSTSDTKYETVEVPKEIFDKYPDAAAILNTGEKSDLNQMSRAEREQYLYDQHRKAKTENVKEKEKEKSSKVCSIM